MRGHDHEIGADPRSLFADLRTAGARNLVELHGFSAHRCELYRRGREIGLLPGAQFGFNLGSRQRQVPRLHERGHRLVHQHQTEVRFGVLCQAGGGRKGRFGEPGSIEWNEHGAEHGFLLSHMGSCIRSHEEAVKPGGILGAPVGEPLRNVLCLSSSVGQEEDRPGAEPEDDPRPVPVSERVQQGDPEEHEENRKVAAHQTPHAGAGHDGSNLRVKER